MAAKARLDWSGAEARLTVRKGAWSSKALLLRQLTAGKYKCTSHTHLSTHIQVGTLMTLTSWDQKWQILENVLKCTFQVPSHYSGCLALITGH